MIQYPSARCITSWAASRAREFSRVKCVRTHRIVLGTSRVVRVNRMRRSAISIHHGKIRGVDLAQTRALARDRSVAHIRARRTSRSTNLDISHFLPISLLPFRSFDELGFFPVRKIVAAKNPQYFVFYDQFNGERSVRKMIRPIVWKVLLRRRCTCLANQRETMLQSELWSANWSIYQSNVVILSYLFRDINRRLHFPTSLQSCPDSVLTFFSRSSQGAITYQDK